MDLNLLEISVDGNRFEVETAPAIVFLKDPGVKPIVYHGIVLSYKTQEFDLSSLFHIISKYGCLCCRSS